MQPDGLLSFGASWSKFDAEFHQPQMFTVSWAINGKAKSANLGASVKLSWILGQPALCRCVYRVIAISQSIIQ